MNKVTIGLEFHIQLNTKQKLFSNALNTYKEARNTQVSLFDVGYPGVLPIINKEAISLAIKAGHGLNMEIDHILKFDRKHYFYSDLPKGYQITQEDRPLGKNGFITLSSGKKIRIDRLHVEEDTCKQVHKSDYTTIDFNRCDIPLIEVVTAPDIETADEAKETAKIIRDLVVELGVSKGKLQEGSLRVDVNVSLKDDDGNLGTKVEIKNINTFENIKKSINYEISRQKSLISNGKSIKQETYRFDELTQSNVLMRIKVDSVDYRCYTDPNILPTKLSDEFIAQAIGDKTSSSVDPLGLIPSEKKTVLLKNKELYFYFLNCYSYYCNVETLINIVTNDCLDLYRNYSRFVDAKDLGKLLMSIDSNLLSKTKARELLKIAVSNNVSLQNLIEKETSIQSDVDLSQIVDEVLNENPQAIEDVRQGKNKAIGFLIKKSIDKTGKSSPVPTYSTMLEGGKSTGHMDGGSGVSKIPTAISRVFAGLFQ